MEAQDILKKLVARKFPTDLLRNAYNNISKMNRLKIFSNTQKQETPTMRLINPYNPGSPKFNQILHEYEGILLMTKKEAIKPEHIQVTYSRSASLRDVLITASLQRNQIPRGRQPSKRSKTS